MRLTEKCCPKFKSFALRICIHCFTKCMYVCFFLIFFSYDRYFYWCFLFEFNSIIYVVFIIMILLTLIDICILKVTIDIIKLTWFVFLTIWMTAERFLSTFQMHFCKLSAPARQTIKASFKVLFFQKVLSLQTCEKRPTFFKLDDKAYLQPTFTLKRN